MEVVRKVRCHKAAVEKTRAFNRDIFPRTNPAFSESRFFHMFQTGCFPSVLCQHQEETRGFSVANRSIKYFMHFNNRETARVALLCVSLIAASYILYMGIAMLLVVPGGTP